MSGVLELIAGQRDVAHVLRVAMGACRGLPGTDAAFVAIARDDGGFAMCATNGMRGSRFGTLVLPPGVGLAGLVADLAEPVHVNDYANDGRFIKPPDLLDVVVGDEHFRTITCVPVLDANNAVFALLYAAARGRQRLERAARRRLETIASYASLRARLIAEEKRERELAILRERQRLATGLHDSVAQALFAIGTEARRLCSGGQLSEPVLRGLGEIDTMAIQAARELRETLHALGRVGDHIQLNAAIALEAARFEEATGSAVVVTGSERPLGLSTAAEALVADTVREGLRNAGKHAGATTVLIHVASARNHVSVSIHDDGPRHRHARATKAAPDLGSGAGIALLDQRARDLGGRVLLRQSDDGGHCLTLTLERGSAS